MASELLLGVAHGPVGAPDRGGGAVKALGAGDQLELAELLGGQRRLGVRVVLVAGEQAPEQAGELACRGDGRDLVAAAGADPLVKRPQWAGLQDDAVRRFNQRPPGLRRPLLGDPPQPGGL